MRYEGCQRGTIELEDENIDYENWPKTQPKKAKTKSGIDGKGKIKWYDRLPYDKFVDDLPMLRYVRGSKTKISITTFDEIGKVCQQIFECNKSFFRFRVQVDLLAHYIGTKILEQIYIVKKGKKKYPLSQLLEDQEQQFLVWDQMKTIKELFSSLCEKRAQGFITKKEMDNLVEKYISTFDEIDHRIKMSSVLDLMIEHGEEHKAKERIRQKDYYKNKQKKKEYGIQGVM
ncbi:MAG: hypothetical protein WC057_06425 [Dehalococcoidales bacterium]